MICSPPITLGKDFNGIERFASRALLNLNRGQWTVRAGDVRFGVCNSAKRFTTPFERPLEVLFFHGPGAVVT